MNHPDLPDAGPDALAHSARVTDMIRQQIRAAGGALPFSRFMELVLYAPGLGYYSAGAHKFGAAGDFVTAPELGQVFARCVAHGVAPVLRTLGPDCTLLELGGGSGAFAEAALRRLAELDALPASYAIWMTKRKPGCGLASRIMSKTPRPIWPLSKSSIRISLER